MTEISHIIRSGGTVAGIGYRRRIDPDSMPVVDLVREQQREKSETTNIAELGALPAHSADRIVIRRGGLSAATLLISALLQYFSIRSER